MTELYAASNEEGRDNLLEQMETFSRAGVAAIAETPPQGKTTFGLKLNEAGVLVPEEEFKMAMCYLGQASPEEADGPASIGYIIARRAIPDLAVPVSLAADYYFYAPASGDMPGKVKPIRSRASIRQGDFPVPCQNVSSTVHLYIGLRQEQGKRDELWFWQYDWRGTIVTTLSSEVDAHEALELRKKELGFGRVRTTAENERYNVRTNEREDLILDFFKENFLPDIPNY